MPQAIFAAIAVAIVEGMAAIGASAGLAVAAGMIAGSLAVAAVGAGISIAGSLLVGALAKKSSPTSSSLAAQSLTITTRNPTGSRQIVYGRVRKGGTIRFMGTTNKRSSLFMAIVLAGHECEAIDEVWFDETLALDAGGVTATYSGSIDVEKHLGASDQAASTLLMANFPGVWTAQHRLRGICYLVVQLNYNATMFRTIPNVTVVMRGKKVYDPRTTLTAYSTNPALQVADYLTDTTYGLGAVYATDISEADLIAAANVCDEDVNIPDGTEDRYTGNGVLDSAETPQRNLELLCSAMAGWLPYSGGKFIVKAGAYEAPTVTLDEEDLRGRIQVQTRIQRRDLCNAVRGVFVSPKHFWQATDFPPVTSATFEAEDNSERVWRDVELHFTTTETMAQRLARIELYATREQLSVTLPCSLAALQLRAGDTVAITNTRLGWTAKAFVITEWRFVSLGSGEGVSALGCELSLRETSSSVYDVTAGDQKLIDDAPSTSLVNPFAVDPPSAPSVAEELYVTRDGSGVKCLVTLTWTGTTDPGVEVSGSYQVERKRLTTPIDADYVVLGRTTDTTYEVFDVAPGTYSFRVKAISVLGISSAYGETTTYISGLGDPPSVLTGLTISTIAGLAILRWTQSVDLDVRIGGQILFRHAQSTASPTWADAVSIGEAVPGSHTVAILPLKSGTYMARAQDSLGILSESTASVTTDAATVLSYAPVHSLSEHAAFAGTKTGLVVSGGDLMLEQSEGTIDDSSFEDGSFTNISGYTHTRTKSSAQAWDGTYSMRVSATDVYFGVYFKTADGSDWLPCSPSTSYAFSIYARAHSTSRNLYCSFVYYDSGNNLVGSAIGSAASITSAGWTRISVVATTTGDAAKIIPMVTCDVTTVGEMFYLDAAQLEQAVAVTDYERVTITPSGTYSHAAGFDFGSKTHFRLTTSLTSLVSNELDLLDWRSGVMDTWADFDGVDGSEADCQVWARTTDDSPVGSPTWSAWQRLDSNEYYCRAVQFQTRLYSYDGACNIYVSELTVNSHVLENTAGVARFIHRQESVSAADSSTARFTPFIRQQDSVGAADSKGVTVA